MESVEVLIGRVGKPHGLRGEVTVDVRTDEPERRFAPGAALRVTRPHGATPAAWSVLTVVSTRWHQGTLLARFAEIEDRNAAEAARGTTLWTDVPADETPEDADEFYDHQLVGLTAYDATTGARLGELTAITHGAQDLLTIRTDDGRDALVPFVVALVPEVDVAGGRLTIADRPGLVAPLPD